MIRQSSGKHKVIYSHARFENTKMSFRYTMIITDNGLKSRIKPVYNITSHSRITLYTDRSPCL